MLIIIIDTNTDKCITIHCLDVSGVHVHVHVHVHTNTCHYTYMHIHIHVHVIIHVHSLSAISCHCPERSSFALRLHLSSSAEFPQTCSDDCWEAHTQSDLNTKHKHSKHIQYIHMYMYMYMCPTRGSSFFLGKVTALGVLCCFALIVCLTLFASFFLPSHLSLKTCTCTCTSVMYSVHVC